MEEAVVGSAGSLSRKSTPYSLSFTWSTLAVNSPWPSWVRTWSPLSAETTASPAGLRHRKPAHSRGRGSPWARAPASCCAAAPNASAGAGGQFRSPGPGPRSAGRVRCVAWPAAAKPRRCSSAVRESSWRRMSSGTHAQSRDGGAAFRIRQAVGPDSSECATALAPCGTPDHQSAAGGVRWSPACGQIPRAAPVAKAHCARGAACS